MKTLKKTLSIVLTLAMMITSLCFFPVDFIKSAFTADAAVQEKGSLAFHVPEAIYLYPEVSSFKASTSSPFQYYIGNTVDEGNIFAVPSPKSSPDKTGKIYFARAGGLSGTPVLSFRFVDKNGNAMSGGSVANTALTAKNNFFYSDITGGTSPSLAGETAGCYIEWKVTYETTAGEKQAAYAYTYVYKPYTVPVGGGIRLVNTSGTDQYVQHVLWFSGVHGFRHGSAGEAQTTYAKRPTYVNNGDAAGMMGFLSKENKGYINGSAHTAGFKGLDGYGITSDMYAVFAGSGHLNTGLNNNACELLLRGDASVPESFFYIDIDRDGWSDHCFQTIYSKAISEINIDTSRYNNLSQIPNFGMGMMTTEDKGNDTMAWYIADHTGRSGKKTDGANKNEGLCRTAYEDRGPVIISVGNGFKNFTTGDENTDGLRYTHSWNKGLSSGSNATYSIKSYHGGKQGKDYAHAFIILDLEAKQTDKGALRTAVNNARAAFPTFGVKDGLGSYYYDTYSPAWINFRNAYLAAEKGLAVVDETVNAAALADNLNNAVNALKNGDGLKIFFDVNYGNINPNLYIPVKNSSPAGFTYSFSNEDSCFTGTSAESPTFGFSSLTLPEGSYTMSATVQSGSLDGPGVLVTDFDSTDPRSFIDIKGNAARAFNLDAPAAAGVNGLKLWVYPNNGSNTFNNYKVRIKIEKGNGQTAYSPAAKVISGSTYGTLPTPERTGYTFAGWYADKACTAAVSSGTAVSYNTLYAKWTPVQYKLVFHGDAGTTGQMSPQVLTYDTASAINANAFIKPGYTFAGWAAVQGGTKVYNPGQSVINLASAASAEVHLYTVWTENTYTVNYNAGGGQGTTASQTGKRYTESFNLSPNGFTRTGYTFTGWQGSDGRTYAAGANVSMLTTVADGVFTMTAQWTPNKYTVTLNNQGADINAGSASAEATFDGVLPSITVPRKTGYQFMGYFTEVNGGGTKFYSSDGTSANNWNIAENKTLYASWSANTYRIHFDGNLNTEGTMSDQNAEYDKTVKLNKNTFGKTGYAFKGWRTSDGTEYADGADVINLTASDGGVITLTAQWQIVPYTVSFNANGGTGTMNSLITDYEQTLTLPENAFIRTGYTFRGWAAAAGGDPQYFDKGSLSNVSSDITLYAVWLANTYNINPIPHNGTTAAPVMAEYDREYTIVNPVKEGYTFMGWAENENGTVIYPAASGGVKVKNLTANVNETVTLHAVWEINEYTVTFDYKGSLTTENVTYGGEAHPPFITEYVKVNARQHEHFTGWDKPYNRITGDTVITAQITTENHTFNLKSSRPATCTETGEEIHICPYCGFERKTNIAAMGHQFTDIAAKEPTCTEDGNIAYKLCSVCGKKFAVDAGIYETNELTDEDVRIPASGHNFDRTKTEDKLTRPVFENGSWKDGYYTYPCLNSCGETETENVKRADYTAYDEAYSQLQSLLDIDLTPEAKVAVNEALSVNRQPDNLIVTEQDRLNAAEAALRAAYNENKDKYNSYNVTFMVDGVQFGEVQRVTRGADAVMPADEPTKAYDETCHYEFTSWDNDGKNITADRVINAQFNAVNHVFTENTEILPTCTAEGLKRFTCTCGYSYTEAIEALHHDWDRENRVLTRPVYENGAWKDGYYTYTCKNNCGETMTENVARADYTAYDEAVSKLNALLNLDLTDEAKAAINEALRINAVNDNLIVTEQDLITVPTANLESAYNTYKDALNVYTVTFMNGTEIFRTVQVTSGQDAQMPADVPAKDYDDTYHYTFADWDNNGKAITADTVINAIFNAQDHVYTSVVFPEPTCLGKGTRTYTCACGHFYTEDVAPLGHDFDKTKSEENLTRPVLQGDTWADGYYTYTCRRDASHKEYEYVKRADYTAYELVRSNLTALINSHALTPEAQSAVETALNDNVARNDYIAPEQPELDAITARLQAVFDANKDQVQTFTVTFRWHGGEDVQTVVINNAASAPADPAVYFDAENHYTFSNWDNAFNKITQDITVNAIYITAPHSFTYEYVNNNYHKVSCSCGYTFNENHMGGAANCTDYAVCDKCLHTYGDLIPDAHDFDMQKSEENLTRPVKENGVWKDGFYTFKCTRNPAHTTTENAARADYRAYDESVNALNGILALDLTDEAKTAINEALTENAVADNLIFTEQDMLNAPTVNLKNAYNTYKDALNVYTVTFMNGTEIFEEVQVTSGQDAVIPAEVPAKAYDETYHYTFKAWDNDGRAVTADRTINAEFNAIEHTYESVINPAPTCEATGTETFTCACGHSYTVTLDASGHDWDRANGVLTRPVYENGAWTDGYYTYTCKRDSAHTMTENVKRAKYTEYEAAAEKLNNLLSADLTQEAKTAVEKAIADNDIPDDRIVSEQSEVDTARDNLLSVYEQYKGALKTYNVTFKWNGGETVVEVISGEAAIAPADPAKYYDENNHYTFESWDRAFTAVKADITVNAVYTPEAHTFTYEYKDETCHTAICSCGYKKDMPHTGGTANCQSPAVCEICNHAYGSKDMTNHAGTETYIKGAVDATCEAKGYTGDIYYVCCDTLKEKGRETPATGHNWDEGVVIKEPTCTTEGVKEFTCRNDSSHTKQETIPVNPEAHVWDEGRITLPATSKSQGEITYTCIYNSSHTKTEKFDAPGGINIPEIPEDGTFGMDADETGNAGNMGDIVDVDPGTDVIYEVKDGSAAEVDEDGNITANDDGDVTVTVKTPDGKFSEEIVISVRTLKTVEFIMHESSDIQKLYRGDEPAVPAPEAYTGDGNFSHQFKHWTKENVKVNTFTVWGDAVYTAVYTVPADYEEFDVLSENLQYILDNSLAEEAVLTENQLKINTVLSHIDEINGRKLTRDESEQPEVDKVTEEISLLIDILYPDMGSSLEIRAKASYYTGHTITDIKVYKMPLGVEEKDVTWTTSDESILFYSNGKFYAVGTGEVTLTAEKGRLKDSVTIDIVIGGNMRTVRFSCMNKMQYIVEDYYAVFRGANFFWSNDEALHFRTYVYSNFGFETYIVYINGVEAHPDANGYYTVPAGSGDVTVSITGGSFDEANPGHKLSFWEMLLAFFRRIIEFFKGLFA